MKVTINEVISHGRTYFIGICCPECKDDNYHIHHPDYSIKELYILTCRKCECVFQVWVEDES